MLWMKSKVYLSNCSHGFAFSGRLDVKWINCEIDIYKYNMKN